jgi:hypothetical protein
LKKVYGCPSQKWQKVQNALVNLAKGDSQVRQPASLLRVPGTFNYKDPDNPKHVKIIKHTESAYFLRQFIPLVKDHGTRITDKNRAPVTTGAKKLGFTPPCITSLLEPTNKPPKGNRHLVRQVIATYAFHEGWPLQDAVQKAMHTTDDPKKAERDVEGVYKVLERDSDRYSVGCGEGSHLKSLVDAGVAACDEKTASSSNPRNQRITARKTLCPLGLMGWWRSC